MIHSISTEYEVPRRVPGFRVAVMLGLAVAWFACAAPPVAFADGSSFKIGSRFWEDEKGNQYAVTVYGDKDGFWYVGTWWTKEGDVIQVSGPINPAPDDPSGDYVLPWEKNPLNPGQSTAPLHPAVIGLERALQMDGGGALVHGKRGLGTLVNPADDDGGGTAGPKPKTQTTGGLKADLATQGLADLSAVEEQVGLANGLGLTDAAYVQLHNPAENGGPVTDGDDDAPSGARPKQDGPMSPGGNGMPSLWDLAHQSLVNPAPYDAADPGKTSFVLLPAKIGVHGQQAGSGPRTPGPSLGLGSVGGQFTSATRTGVPRPPR
jgi:hypothetical protein